MQYLVLRRLVPNAGGPTILPGATIELADEVAAILVQRGAVAALPPPASALVTTFFVEVGPNPDAPPPTPQPARRAKRTPLAEDKDKEDDPTND